MDLIPHHVMCFLNTGAWGQAKHGSYYGSRVTAEPYTKATILQQGIIDAIHQEADKLPPDTVVPIQNRPLKQNKPPDILCYTCGMCGIGPLFDSQQEWVRRFACNPITDNSIVHTDSHAADMINHYFSDRPIYARYLAPKKQTSAE